MSGDDVVLSGTGDGATDRKEKIWEQVSSIVASLDGERVFC